MSCPTQTLLIAAGVTVLSLAACADPSSPAPTTVVTTPTDRIYGQTNPPDDRLSRTSSPSGVSGFVAGTGAGSGVGSAASSAAGGTAGNSTGAASGLGSR